MNFTFSAAAQIIYVAMGIIGLWFIFPKFGQKKWYTFIPIYRSYKLAQCAGMEDEGRLWCACEFVSTVILNVEEFLNLRYDIFNKVDNLQQYLFLLMLVTFGIIYLIYSIRIYSSLCKIFKRKRINVLWWMLFKDLMAFIWGISDKIQPSRHTLEHVHHGPHASESGLYAEVIPEGLTININSRKAKNGLKSKTLIRDIHLNIEQGRMVLLLGGSGAGKTTFVNAVTGYEKADAEVYLDGIDVYKEYDKMKYNIGFVPQQDLIRYNDTVYRTLLDAATLRLPASVHKKQRQQRVEEVMEIFGLTPVKNNIVGKQSGGQKKRISIAAEFISDPSLFILDEPDSGLDGILAKDLMRRLHDISREGKIVVVITHTPDRVIDMFDDVIVLAKDADRTGRLVYYGPVEEAKEFFGLSTMEDIVKSVNRKEEGGLGNADELIQKYSELCNGRDRK